MSVKEPVLTRLPYYQKAYYFWRKISFYGVGVSFALASLLVVVILVLPTQGGVIAVDKTGKTTTIETWDYPQHSPSALRLWAISAISECLNFGHHNFKSRLEICRPYFSEAGFKGYRAALNNPDNKIAERILDDRLIMSAVVSKVPQVIEQSKSEADRLWWKIRAPVTITFEKGNARPGRKHIVDIVVSRLESSERLSGIGITQWRQKNANK